MKKRLYISVAITLFFLSNSCAIQNDLDEFVVVEEKSESGSNSNGTGHGHGGDINPPPARNDRSL
ncbi:MAG: hypothetical protein WBA74_25695 [Cyclobacteriaceae bacterium]